MARGEVRPIRIDSDYKRSTWFFQPIGRIARDKPRSAVISGSDLGFALIWTEERMTESMATLVSSGVLNLSKPSG